VPKEIFRLKIKNEFKKKENKEKVQAIIKKK